VDDFTSGRFEPVIDDARIEDRGAVDRIVLHSGKIHYDLLAEAQKRNDLRTALVRVEQYYPVPRQELLDLVGSYPEHAEIVWAQDEPANQGAAPFVTLQAFATPFVNRLRVISRPASASPAVGSAKRHAAEQAELVERVFAREG
jgi:2-oxoglutarate dehydrogenase E1 component